MRKDEKVQPFSLPLPQHAIVSWQIDEIAHSKLSEDCSGMFPPSVGFPAGKELKLQVQISEGH